jgi:hypothetical protein
MPYTFNKPTHHKYAAVRFLFNRLNSYNLKHDEYQHELNIIYNILQNNGFPITSHKPHAPYQPNQKIRTPPKNGPVSYILVRKLHILRTNLEKQVLVLPSVPETLSETYVPPKTPTLIYIHYQEHTNSPAPIATRLTSEKLVDSSGQDIKNTQPPSVKTTMPTASPDTLMIRHTPLAI